MRTRAKTRRAPALLSKHEGPSAGELNDAAPAPLVAEKATTYAEEKGFEEREREILWAWEDELCRRVRAGEISIEAAVRAAGLHASIVQINQSTRTDIRQIEAKYAKEAEQHPVPF